MGSWGGGPRDSFHRPRSRGFGLLTDSSSLCPIRHFWLFPPLAFWGGLL